MEESQREGEREEKEGGAENLLYRGGEKNILQRTHSIENTENAIENPDRLIRTLGNNAELAQDIIARLGAGILKSQCPSTFTKGIRCREDFSECVPGHRSARLLSWVAVA